MRLYYIFSIKKDIYNLTKNNEEKLYILLKNIYNMKENDGKLGYKVFSETCDFLEKEKINKLIKNLNYDNLSYMVFKNTHNINDFYRAESTKMIINNSHILIKTNTYYPLFFSQIKHLKNLFICDFINEDYFFLNKINYKNKSKVR